MTAAISLRGVGKRYRLTADTLAQRLSPLKRGKARVLWALKNLDLEVAAGETIGIIGRNGSGKTTLLRLLSGVSAPSTGHLEVVGRTAPLIGVGVGFNKELTGRENVLVNAQLLGLSREQVRQRFDAIVEFSEIGAFIDSPVKYYSSGMFLRLAFAVAVHTNPDVMLVDEVLAVGDLAFQRKCTERMREIQSNGATIVIVTHNVNSLHELAPRAVLLSHGEAIFDGPTKDAVGALQRVLEQETRDHRGRDLRQADGGGRIVGGARVRCELSNPRHEPTNALGHGEALTIDVTVEFDHDVIAPLLGVMVSARGVPTPLYGAPAKLGAYNDTHGPDRPLRARINLATDRLLSGSYDVAVSVQDANGQWMLGHSPSEPFFVAARPTGFGIANLDARLYIDGQDVPLGLPTS